MITLSLPCHRKHVVCKGEKKRIAPVALRTYCNSHVLNLSIAVARRLTPVTET